MVTLRPISGMSLGMNSTWTHEVVVTSENGKVIYPCTLEFGDRLVNKLQRLGVTNCDSSELQKIVKELKEEKIMGITKEHYRDFIGSLAHKRAEVNTEIKALEHMKDRREWWDFSDEMEWDYLYKSMDYYTKVQKYFLGHYERWAEFEDLDSLRQYVETLNNSYKALDKYSNAVLPIDGQETVGVTNDEWEELESMRYNLSKRLSAWSTFLDFCEYGHIE